MVLIVAGAWNGERSSHHVDINPLARAVVPGRERGDLGAGAASELRHKAEAVFVLSCGKLVGPRARETLGRVLETSVLRSLWPA